MYNYVFPCLHNYYVVHYVHGHKLHVSNVQSTTEAVTKPLQSLQPFFEPSTNYNCPLHSYTITAPPQTVSCCHTHSSHYQAMLTCNIVTATPQSIVMNDCLRLPPLRKSHFSFSGLGGLLLTRQSTVLFWRCCC